MPKQSKSYENGFFELSDQDLSRLEARWLELILHNFNSGQLPKVRLLEYHWFCSNGSFLLVFES